jgi:hypothetical protein
MSIIPRPHNETVPANARLSVVLSKMRMVHAKVFEHRRKLSGQLAAIPVRARPPDLPAALNDLPDEMLV